MKLVNEYCFALSHHIDSLINNISTYLDLLLSIFFIDNNLTFPTCAYYVN